MPFKLNKIDKTDIQKIVEFLWESGYNNLKDVKFGTCENNSLFHKLCNYLGKRCNETNRITLCALRKSKMFQTEFEKQWNLGMDENCKLQGDNYEIHQNQSSSEEIRVDKIQIISNVLICSPKNFNDNEVVNIDKCTFPNYEIKIINKEINDTNLTNIILFEPDSEPQISEENCDVDSRKDNSVNVDESNSEKKSIENPSKIIKKRSFDSSEMIKLTRKLVVPNNLWEEIFDKKTKSLVSKRYTHVISEFLSNITGCQINIQSKDVSTNRMIIRTYCGRG